MLARPRRRRPRRLYAFALLAFAAWACASNVPKATTPRATSEPKASEQAPVLEPSAALRALGAPDAPRHGDGVEELLQRAAAADALGAHASAEAALSTALARARAAHALARLDGGDAEALLARARQGVLAASARRDRDWLALEALQPLSASSSLAPAERARLRALITGERVYLDADTRAAALALFAQDAEISSRLQSHVPYGTAASLEQLQKLGADDVDELQTALDRALQGDDLPRARNIAALLLKVDPLHLEAALLPLLAGEARARRPRDPKLAPAKLLARSERYSGHVLARLQLRAAREKLSIGERLVYALHTLDAELGGDCLRALETLSKAERARPSVAQVAGTLEALCALSLGDGEVLERWAREARPERSWSVLERLIEPQDVAAGSAREHWQRWAEERALERGLSLVGRNGAVSVLTEPEADPALRARAREHLLELGAPEPLLEACRTRDREGCQKLLDAHEGFEDPDEASLPTGEALAALAEVPGYPLPWDQLAFAFEEDALPVVVAELRKAGGAARSSGQLVASLYALLHHGQAKDCLAQLERHGALLSLDERIELRLAALSIAAGVEPAELLADAYPRPAFVGLGPEQPQEPDREANERIARDGANHPLVIYHAAHAYYDAGALQEARASLEKIAPLLEGEERAAIEASLAIVDARLSRKAEARARAERVRAAAPERAFTRLVLARLAEQDGDRARAHAEYRAALLDQPTDQVAFAGVLRTLPESADLPRLRAFAGALAPASYWADTLEKKLADLPPTDAASARVLAGPYGEASFALGERGMRNERLDGEAIAFVDGRASKLDDAAQVKAWAARAVAYARQLKPAPVDERWAYMHFLAGDPAVGAAAIGADDAEHDGHPLVALAAARARKEIDDDAAAKLYRERRRWTSEPLRAVQALQRNGSSDPGVQHYLCRLLVDANLPQPATRHCAAAWQSGRRNPDLAGAVSWLVDSAPDDAASVGLTADAVFEHPGADAEALGAAFAYNRAVWLYERERWAEASEQLDAAWADGFGVQGGNVPEHAAEPHAPLAFAVRFVVATSPRLSRAQRMMALASFAMLDVDPSAMRHYGEAAGREGLVADPKVATAIYAVVDLAELLAADLEQRALPIDAARDAIEPLREQNLARLVELSEQYPKSAFLQLSASEARLAQGQIDAALASSEALLQRFPDNPSLLLHGVQCLVAKDRKDDARALFERMRAHRPDDRRLGDLERLFASGAPKPLPPSLLSAAAFDRSTAGAAARVAEGEVTRSASLEDDFEVFVPRGWEAALAGHESFVHEDGVVLDVRRAPRAGYCEPERCLTLFLSAFTQRGARVVWSRMIDAPLGRAGQALIHGPGGAALLFVQPIRRSIYVLTAHGAPDALERRAPELVAVAQGLRVLSAVMPAGRAEAVREQLWFPDARVRLRGRMLAASSSETQGCPIAPLLSELHDPDARAALIADLLLSSEPLAQRRALLRCTAPERREAQSLGMIAALDEDDDVHRFGLAAVEAHAREALQMAQAMVSAGDDVRQGNTDAVWQERSPYGLLEALLALPDAQRRELCKSLLQSSDKELHLLGLAAASFVPDVVPAEILEADIRSAPANTAVLAVHAAQMSDDDVSQLPALRARLGSMPAPRDGEERRLYEALALAVARRLDAADAPLLETVTARVAAAPDAAGSAEVLRRYADTHRDALLRKQGKPPPADSTGDEALARRWSTRFDASRDDAQPVSPARLYALSLADLVPDGAYFYAQLRDPGVAVALARKLLRDVDLGDDTDSYVMRRALLAEAERNGLGLLSPDGGLDLTRKIECLQSPGSTGFACTAYVRDPARVRTLLGQRPTGTDAGTALVIHALRAALQLPSTIGSTLGRFHRLLHPPPSSGAPGRSRLLGERVRTHERVLGHELDRFASIEVYEGRGVLIDHEHYLLVRDKLFVFGGRYMAELVLGGPGATPLSAGKSFAAARARFSYARALQGAWTGPAGSAQATAVAVALSAGGVALEWRSTAPGDARAYEALQAALPQGAAASFVSGIGGMLGVLDESLSGLRPSEQSGEPPPSWLLRLHGPSAFGWYPEAQHGLWSRWSLALPASPEVLAVLQRQGAALDADGARARVDALALERRGDAVLIVSDDALLRGAHAPAQRTRDTFRMQVAPRRVADSFERLLQHAQSPEAQRAARTQATLVRALQRLDLRGSPDPNGGYAVRGRMDFAIRASSGSEQEVVKRWLQVKNALALPNGASAPDERRPIVYVLEVDDAERLLARSVARDPRLSLRATSPRTLELQVAPGARRTAAAPPLPLAPDALARLTGPAELLDTQAPALIALARRVTADLKGRSPQALAERVSHWVHENLRYEVTPESVGTLELIATKRGDCTEYSNLTVAMLRALGVPAEQQQGLLASDGEMVAHAWVRYHDGKGFRELDPTNDQLEVGARHVPVSVAEVLGLLALERVKVKEVRQ